jgi:hypothetical protein
VGEEDHTTYLSDAGSEVFEGAVAGAGSRNGAGCGDSAALGLSRSGSVWPGSMPGVGDA